MKPNKTTITFFLFVLVTNLFSQVPTLSPYFVSKGSLLCKEPFVGITEFRNSQNYGVSSRLIKVDSLHHMTTITYFISPQPRIPGIKNDTIYDLGNYVPVKAFDTKLDSRVWYFYISYQVEGISHTNTPVGHDLFATCFEPSVICDSISVAKKYIRGQCESYIARTGHVVKQNDSLSFVFVDTTFQNSLQFMCLQDQNKPLYTYYEVVLTEKNNLPSYKQLLINNKRIEVTKNGNTFVKEEFKSNEIIKSIRLDHSTCITSSVEEELLSENEVFPNPAIDLLYVKSKPAYIQLTDAYGKTTTVQGDGTYSIETLMNGLYVLTYQTTQERKSYKVQIK